MDIKVSKGAYERMISVSPWSLPPAAVANVVSIGFRNLPHISMEQITELPSEANDWSMTVRVEADKVAEAGLLSILNDAHASIKVDAEDMQAKVDALVDRKLAALIAGTVRVGGGGGRVGDPIKRRAVLIATPRAKALLGKDADDKAIRRKAIELVEGNPAYRHLAERQLQDEAALGLAEEPIDENDEGSTVEVEAPTKRKRAA